MEISQYAPVVEEFLASIREDSNLGYATDMARIASNTLRKRARFATLPRISREQRAYFTVEAARLRALGWKDVEIGDKFGVCSSTISHWVRAAARSADK